MTDRFQSAEERAFYLCGLLHMASDIIEEETEIDATTKAELVTGLQLAMIAALRWRKEASPQLVARKQRN